ncbi:MAG: YceI family protein [Pirellulaceae bacterium]
MKSVIISSASLILVALSAALFSHSPATARQADEDADKRSTSYQPGEAYLRISRAYIYVGATGFGHPHGVEGPIKQARVLLDAADDAGEIVFDMSSFAVDTDRAREHVGLGGTIDAGTQRQVTATMRGGEVLNVRRYPTATFRIDSAKKMDGLSDRELPRYQLKGEFTLHGKKRPLTVVADVEEKNGWLHVRGKFSIRQTDYGMSPYRRAFGAVGVANQLTIWGDLWIAKEQMVVKE